MSIGVFGPIESPLDRVEETDLEAGLLLGFNGDVVRGLTVNGGGCCMVRVGDFLDLKPMAVAKLESGLGDEEDELFKDHHRAELSALLTDITEEVIEKVQSDGGGQRKGKVQASKSHIDMETGPKL